MITMVQGVSSVASGIMMVTGAFDSLTTAIAENNVSFSTILSTATSFLMAIPMIASGLGSVFKGFKDVGNAIKLAKEAQEASNATTVTGIGITKLFTKAGRE
jgi:hypothetical protein